MTTEERPLSILKRPGAWLALGGLLVFLANLRWGVGLLAWVAPVPLLRYLRLTQGWRSRALFAAALVGIWIATTLKIITAPVPAVAAVFFGTGVAVFHVGGYLGADAVRRRLGETRGAFVFPALMVTLEWLQHRVTGLASWGAAAYTQLDDLPLLQVASVFGIAGVGFLVYWVAACAESALSARLDWVRTATMDRNAWIAAGALVLAHVFGAARLAQTLPGSSRVAAIGTDGTFTPGSTPDAGQRARVLDALFAHTDEAARAGAKLAVWNEGSAFVPEDEEPALVARLQALAVKDGIHIVAAYVVPARAGAARYENKYRWVRADGALDHTYLKHHPVPVEPAIAGVGALSAVDTDFGRLGGAICYDYDFPESAREHGALGVDLVALPSSDWRGIDPIHTQMASLRAIEEGFSVLRSTRFGLTAGIDPLGRVHAQRSSFDTDDRVLVVDLPRHGVVTAYRRFGDVLVYASVAFVALSLAQLRRRRAAAGARLAAEGTWSDPLAR